MYISVQQPSQLLLPLFNAADIAVADVAADAVFAAADVIAAAAVIEKSLLVFLQI